MVNLEQCRKAELYSGNELVCEASVTAGPMGSILLDVPRSVAYGKDKPYLVKFYDPSLGVLTCRCVLSGPMDLPEDMRSLRCDIVEQLEQLQRREDVKVTVNVPIMLHAERRPGDLYIPLKGWPAMVRNISAGGVYVSTDLSLSAGREIEFEFNETGEKVHLMNCRQLAVNLSVCRPAVRTSCATMYSVRNGGEEAACRPQQKMTYRGE